MKLFFDKPSVKNSSPLVAKSCCYFHAQEITEEY